MLISIITPFYKGNAFLCSLSKQILENVRMFEGNIDVKVN